MNITHAGGFLVRPDPIREFETQFDPKTHKWLSRISINVKYIAAVQFLGKEPGRDEYCAVLMGGSSNWYQLNAPYADVMDWWEECRGVSRGRT